MAEYFAAHGYAALALSWCGAEGCPADVIDIPLDHTVAALGWLRNHAQVRGRRTGLYGISRGAEQALIISTFLSDEEKIPRADALALHAPSDVIVQGWSWDWVHPRCPTEQNPQARAWTWKGSSVGLEPGTRIEVERFRGPIFLSHGEKDHLWEVERSKRLEKARLDAGLPVEVLYPQDEGHQFWHDAESLRRAKLLDFFHRHLRA
jgi:dienelactone hydrolase